MLMTCTDLQMLTCMWTTKRSRNILKSFSNKFKHSHQRSSRYRARHWRGLAQCPGSVAQRWCRCRPDPSLVSAGREHRHDDRWRVGASYGKQQAFLDLDGEHAVSSCATSQSAWSLHRLETTVKWDRTVSQTVMLSKRRRDENVAMIQTFCQVKGTRLWKATILHYWSNPHFNVLLHWSSAVINQAVSSSFSSSAF